jgi:hypothetical protein
MYMHMWTKYKEKHAASFSILLRTACMKFRPMCPTVGGMALLKVP